MADLYEQLDQPRLAARSLFLEGEDYRDLGELEKAAQSLERSLELHASSPWAHQAYEILDDVAATLR